MNKVTILLLPGMLLLSLAAPGFAENESGTMTLDPFTGGYLHTSQHKNNANYFGLRSGYNLTENFALEGMFGYFETQDYDLVNAFGNDLPNNSYRLGLDALLHFNSDGVLVPFLAIGGGVLAVDNPPGWDNEQFGLFDWGAGLKWFIADAIALRGDARHLIYSEADSLQNNFELTVGLNFLLGAEKNVDEPAPSEPMVICTSPDNGVSGVATERSVIATFSEPMDTETITDRTFTVTHDDSPIAGTVMGSGVNGATFNPTNGFKNGTTYTATIKVGVNDADGETLMKPYAWQFTTLASPKVAETPKVAIPVLITLEDSHFDFNSSELTENGKTILNMNARIMAADPKMKIRIAGYSSASGTNEYNQTLSEQRATAVKEYLVKEGGIDRNRLTKIGYGETRPAEYEAVPEDLYSEAAKANMRVLFELIVK